MANRESYASTFDLLGENKLGEIWVLSILWNTRSNDGL